jgi:uncharacterized protein YndB with AHSA1/START domain
MSDLGEITRCYSLRYERRSKHSPERLWRAITDPGEVSRWMSYPARIDLRVGGDYFVDFSRTDQGSLDGVIVRIEPGQKLAYVWGLSVVEWTLEPDGDGCRYAMVHHGQAPREIPDEEGLAVGWHQFLEDFAAHLRGEAPSAKFDLTTELARAYRKRLDEVLGTGA